MEIIMILTSKSFGINKDFFAYIIPSNNNERLPIST